MCTVSMYIIRICTVTKMDMTASLCYFYVMSKKGIGTGL